MPASASTPLSSPCSTSVVRRWVVAVAAATVFAVTALVVVLVGPAAVAGAAPAANPLQGRTFVSDTVSGNNPLPGGGQITMVFGAKDRIGVNAGCNQQSSTVDLSGGRFKVAMPMAATLKACPPPADKADAWVAAFLAKTPEWKLDDATLTLRTRDVMVRLVDRKAAADRPLIGTTWTVTTLLSKKGARPAPQQHAPTLKFENFSVSGTTGCNTYSGPAVPVTALIVFGPVSTTRKMCSPTQMRTESHMRTVLSGVQTYSISGKTLTLVNSDGVGVVAQTKR